MELEHLRPLGDYNNYTPEERRLLVLELIHGINLPQDEPEPPNYDEYRYFVRLLEIHGQFLALRQALIANHKWRSLDILVRAYQMLQNHPVNILETLRNDRTFPCASR